ncbi:MAG: divergent PAP2 family protein [Oscillospiraceae bacterium]|nr:divergent PAP2 family protein [Oscillospiraceae bacterium]
MDKIAELFHNYVLITALLSWFVAQVLKTLLTLIVTKKFTPERLVGAGGMPSAHSATVCSLVVAISREVGFHTPEFAIAVVLAAVVMYDAMGVRRAAGEQAKVLNKMLERQYGDEEDSEFAVELKEFLGHTPLQVLAGALLGILIAMIMPR